MTHKSTDELKNELKTAANLRDYLSKNKENLLTTGLPEYLERLLSQKGLKKSRRHPRLPAWQGLRVQNFRR